MGKQHCGASRGDIISGLPDCILVEILSLLDMKHAVQTSILSKRWRYLWTSLRRLVFNADLFRSPKGNRYDGFQHFVFQVLLFRENSDIDMFHLSSNPKECKIKSFLDLWILAAIKHKVQTLSLDIWSYGIMLPSCIFKCTSLKDLRLVMVGSKRWVINLPMSMSLPNLKVLKLGSLSFNDEHLTNNFFLNCPNLEELTLEDVEFLQMNVNISALKLEKFTVKNHLQGYGWGYGPCSYGPCGYCRWFNTMFRLYAPNLSSICCQDYMFSNYIFDNLTSLVHADIDMKVEEKEEDPIILYYFIGEKVVFYAQQMMQFLKGLHHVKHLKLSAWFLEVISRSPDLLSSQQTDFCDLTCLKLETRLARGTICAITYLLKISPILESFCLEISKIVTIINPTKTEDYWEEWFPLCNLKFVTIQGAIGCVNELKFLEILLRNAMVLEKLVIFTSKENMHEREKRLMNFSETLLAFPRVHCSTELLFHHLILAELNSTS